MNAAILVGGRGTRMKPLTNYQQKGTLEFQGRTLLGCVVDTLLETEMIEEVYILTGYRWFDVHRALLSSHSRQIKQWRVVIIDYPHIRGTFSRLVAAAKILARSGGVCVCGIDSLVSGRDASSFLNFAEQNSQSVCLLVSPPFGCCTNTSSSEA